MAANEQVLAEALRLRPSDPADLAAALLANLDEGEDAGAAGTWDAELARRAAEIDSGKVQQVSSEKLARRLRDEIGLSSARKRIDDATHAPLVSRTLRCRSGAVRALSCSARWISPP